MKKFRVIHKNNMPCPCPSTTTVSAENRWDAKSLDLERHSRSVHPIKIISVVEQK